MFVISTVSTVYGCVQADQVIHARPRLLTHIGLHYHSPCESFWEATFTVNQISTFFVLFRLDLWPKIVSRRPNFTATAAILYIHVPLLPVFVSLSLLFLGLCFSFCFFTLGLRTEVPPEGSGPVRNRVTCQHPLRMLSAHLTCSSLQISVFPVG